MATQTPLVDPNTNTISMSQLQTLMERVAGEVYAKTLKENAEKGAAIEAAGQAPAVITKIVEGESNKKKELGEEEERGLRVARMLRLYAAGKGIRSEMVEIAKVWEKSYSAEYTRDVTKALSAGVPGGAAELVPPNFVAEVIELLRAVTVVRSSGARVVPMPGGTLTYPKQTAAAGSDWVGEGEGQNASEEETGSIGLSAKKHRITVPITNDLLRYAGVDADAFVRDDMLQVIRIGEDITFIRSAGTQHRPKGLRYWAPLANIIPANVTVNLANVTVDLGKLVLALEEANVSFTRPVWLIAPRIRHYLMTVRDGNGNFVFRQEMLGGSLWGFPWKSTTSIPRNLGGGTESEVYLVDMSDVLIGDVHGLEVEASREASYRDSGGTLVSAFDRDETVLRGIQRVDLGVRHEESIAVLTGVTWGA